MECWYDSLFSVNCAGVHALLKVPCLHGIGSVGMTWRGPGQGPEFGSLFYPPLAKRLHWIYQCGNIVAGFLHVLDNFKTNRTTFFFEANRLARTVRFNGGFRVEAYTPLFNSCYHLGSYQKYWNADNDLMVSANNLMTRNVWGVGTEPRIPEIPSSLMKTALDEDIKYFYGEKRFKSVIAQREYFARRKKAYQDCMDKHFPKPIKPYLFEKPGTKEPLDWPGKPMNQQILPSPTAVPGPLPRAPDKKITLVLEMGEKPAWKKEGLDLHLFFEEEYI